MSEEFKDNRFFSDFLPPPVPNPPGQYENFETFREVGLCNEGHDLSLKVLCQVVNLEISLFIGYPEIRFLPDNFALGINSKF